MKIRRSCWLPGLFWETVLFAFLTGCASLPVSPPGTRPVITHSYCVEKAHYGDILKIYIEADDPGGYMARIATVVNQVGYGSYSTNWVYLESPYPHHLLGYLEWNTFNPRVLNLPEWTRITIEVSVFDTDGNQSNAVALPVTFVSEAVSNPPPLAPFGQPNIPRLGYVNINLVNPLRREKD
jgi:hypothetical protein